jgi:hypothetical protein
MVTYLYVFPSRLSVKELPELGIELLETLELLPMLLDELEVEELLLELLLGGTVNKISNVPVERYPEFVYCLENRIRMSSFEAFVAGLKAGLGGLFV